MSLAEFTLTVPSYFLRHPSYVCDKRTFVYVNKSITVCIKKILKSPNDAAENVVPFYLQCDAPFHGNENVTLTVLNRVLNDDPAKSTSGKGNNPGGCAVEVWIPKRDNTLFSRYVCPVKTIRVPDAIYPEYTIVTPNAFLDNLSYINGETTVCITRETLLMKTPTTVLSVQLTAENTIEDTQTFTLDEHVLPELMGIPHNDCVSIRVSVNDIFVIFAEYKDFTVEFVGCMV